MAVIATCSDWHSRAPISALELALRITLEIGEPPGTVSVALVHGAKAT